ncbi:phage minor head protein [Sphingomonas sp. TX0522]|uniref:phage minor head protein n=1 Tax=Sphingomonas sp. TX0522 TaxID=2479205 RepID=UPI002FCCCC37
MTLRDIPPPAMLATDLFQGSYRPVLTLLSRYADRLNAEYGRSLSALQTDSADDLTSILAALGDELSRLVLSLTPSLRNWTIRLERYHRSKWRGAVLAASSVDLDTIIGPQDVQQTLEDALNWNVSLVRDVGDQAKQKMANAVFAGLRARSPARDVAKQISEATGFARKRSLGIAADQLSKLSASLSEERQRQAGIEIVQYKSSHKLHARPWHAARDGKLYYLDTRTPVDGGEAVDASDWAGAPPWCGCRTLATIQFD